MRTICSSSWLAVAIRPTCAGIGCQKTGRIDCRLPPRGHGEQGECAQACGGPTTCRRGTLRLRRAASDPNGLSHRARTRRALEGPTQRLWDHTGRYAWTCGGTKNGLPYQLVYEKDPADQQPHLNTARELFEQVYCLKYPEETPEKLELAGRHIQQQIAVVDQTWPRDEDAPSSSSTWEALRAFHSG